MTKGEVGHVDVVTPAYRAAGTIDETIRSVRAQTHADWDLWVVDDGSPDDTAAIVRRHAAEDTRVHLLQQANRGAAHARNAALAGTRGPAVAFLDADDAWHPQFLARLLDALAEHPQAGFAWCDMEIIGDGQGTYRGSTPPIAGPAGATLEAIYRGVTFLPSCTLFRHAPFAAGLRWRQETSPMEDMPIFLAVARQAAVVHVPEALARYRVHAGSSTTARGAIGRNYPSMVATFRDLHAEHRDLIPRAALHERLWWIYHHAADNQVCDGARPLPLLAHALRHRPGALVTWKVLAQALLGGREKSPLTPPLSPEGRG